MSDWNPQANEIFLVAIELASSEERQALLDERCGDDGELRAQVESLLSASDEAGDFLEQPVVEPAPTILGDEVHLDFLGPSQSPDSLGRLGEYEIARVIGRGGMGIVLEGRDAKLNRVVAIKVLAPEMAGNATARRRFLREAQAAAAVTHQQVVTIHAVSDDRLPYLVMECVDGQSLQEKIESAGTLALKEILRIGSQIAAGLAAAHAQGLIHRDIKPSNILLENGVERVRITDFGLARAVDDVSITGTGQVAGSPQYMSPEQAQGHTVDARSDLFSLGCVLYAMCTGRSPFRADTTVAALRRVCDETPRPIREVNPEVPGWLAQIVNRLLEKDPRNRIQTASDVADLLGGYLAHVQDPDSTPRPMSQPQIRSRAQRRWSHVLTAAVVLLLGIGGLYLAETTGITNLIGTVDPATTVTTNGTVADDAEVPDATPVAGPRGEVDLLRFIDVNEHSVGSAWHFENDTLVSPGTGRWDRLDIVYATPEEYDLEVTAERRAGDDMLSITLLSGQHEFFVGLDMFEGRLCGLGLLDGKDAFTNETTTERTVFADRLPHKIVCRVRRDGVGVTVDGDVVIDWRGNLDRLSIPEYGRTGHLGLMAMRSEYRFFDVVLKPVREESDGRPVITEVQKFEGHTGPVKQVAISRDGTRALSGSGYPGGDRSVRLWEVSTGREVHALVPSDTQVLTVCFSHDGQRAAGSGIGGVVDIWDVETGRLITSIPTGTEVVDDLEFSPDGRHLLCATHKRAFVTDVEVSNWGQAQLWDLDTEDLVWEYESQGWLTTGAFLHDGERVIVAGKHTGNQIQFLDRNTGVELRQLQFGDVDDHQIEELAVSHDGEFIAAASEQGYVCLWDVNEGEEPVKYRTNLGNLRSVAFSPDGGRLLCGGGEGEYGSLQLLVVPSLQKIASLEYPTGLVWHVVYHPDGQHALSAGGWSDDGPGDYALRLWRLPEIEGVSHSPADSVVMPEAVRYPTTHSGPVLSIAASPDGRVIATGSSDNTIQLFDRDTRAALPELTGHTAYDLKFTSEGQLLSADNDGMMRLWDVETGDEIRRFVGHGSWVSSVDLSQNGRIVLSSSHDGTIRFWDFDSTNQLHQIDVDTSRLVFCVRFDVDGERFVSAHYDGTVTIWDTATREEIKTITAHDGNAYIARFSPDGRTLLTTGDDNVACLWNIDSGRRLHTLPHGESVTEGEFLADGRFVVTSSGQKTLRVWSVETGREVATATGLTHCMSSLALLPDESHVVSAGGLLDARIDNEKRVWIGDGDYDIRLWRLPDFPGVPKFPADSAAMPELARYRTTHSEPVFSIAVSPDGRVIATGSSDNTIQLYDRDTSTTRQVLDGHFALGLRFTSDGRQLLSAGDDGTLRLWDVESGEEIRRFAGHVGWVLSVDLSDDGRTVLSGGEDGTIRLWEFDTGEELDRAVVDLEVEVRAVFSVRYSSDGTRIVSSHHDGTVTVWDASTLDEITTITAHSGKAYTARLSPTGRILATSGNDDVGCLWDVASRRRLHTFPHAENVTIAEFIGGDRFVVTGSGDKTVRVWSAVTGQEVAHATASTHCTTAVALLPDGHLVSAGGLLSARTEGGAPVWEGDGDYDLRVWRLPAIVRARLEQSPSIDTQIGELTAEIIGAPTDGQARIARAHLYVRKSRWRDAADDLEAAGDAVYEEPGNAFLYAVLLVHLGEIDLHQQHCEKMLEHFADTDDVWTANCLVKSCLLRPGVVELDNLPMHLLSDDYEFASGEPGWVLSEARALFAYRAGDFEKAREQIRDTLDEPSYRDDSLYAPRALSILAMAAHQSGNAPLAQGLLDRALEEFEQIQLEPDDIRAAGWVYAGILRRAAAGLVRPGAFVIVREGAEQVFDSLAQAVDASMAGDAIEIRGDGPYLSEPIEIRQALTIRAGRGASPVIRFRPGASSASMVTHGPLVLEGLGIEGNEAQSKLLRSTDGDGSLRVANCRFLKNANGGFGITGEARDVVLRNCEFLLPDDYSVAFTCRADGRWLIENCIHVGPITFFDPSGDVPFPESSRPASIRLSRNTVVALWGTVFGRFRSSEFPEGDGSAAIQVDASENVFITQASALTAGFTFPADLGTNTATNDSARFLANLIDWRGQRNVYTPGSAMLLFRIHCGEQLHEVVHAGDLNDWNDFWGLSDTGSFEALCRLQGGDVAATAQDTPRELAPEDFRLVPDSTASETLNVGADVDLVGPGEAYERWKQTPEYAEWLEETRQLK